MAAEAEAEVLARFEDEGDRGVCTITLNRPSKLNALNLNMIQLLHSIMDEVDSRSGRLGCLVMEGSGGKAFCAGGDVVRVREESMNGGTLPQDFFFEEYSVVFRLATLFERTGCCQVSIWDGVTMGGGVGLSSHGPFRVATEKTVFAKPEMAIGFFPDVGSTYKLGRLKAGTSVGRFIGLTGQQFKAWDCIYAGLATHFVPAANLRKLRDLLSKSFRSGLTGNAAKEACEAALEDASDGAAPDPSNATFTDENLEVIERCFSASSLEEIVSRLKAEPGKFASETLQHMIKSCSPTSCKVTLHAISNFAAEDVSLGYALQMEYRLSQRFTLRPQPFSDFYEGIRAVLIDKDRKQRWQPSWDELASVTEEKVAHYFSPLESGHHRGELVLDCLTAGSKARPAIVKSRL
eukprot:TRINITY_DN79287_c0_g1_i1.p1 TRINITY_DN79287_c0_g1~~TRINITY_DN79287_c0_g1_i1.p1  ORF type:complete len:406 (+),score=74.48 TRINITY_DN79287_c0_g1_i1:105-1322(+)